MVSILYRNLNALKRQIARTRDQWIGGIKLYLVVVVFFNTQMLFFYAIATNTAQSGLQLIPAAYGQ